MAAPAGKMRRASDDSSSSSDEEALRRCQEAVWESKPDRQKGDNGSVRVVERHRANMAAGLVRVRGRDASLSEVSPCGCPIQTAAAS